MQTHGRLKSRQRCTMPRISSAARARPIRERSDPSSAQKIALPFFAGACPRAAIAASCALRRRAFADHQLKAEVDHRLRRAAAFDGVDHHGDGVPAHFIAIGAHAGERGYGGCRELQVVEADNGQISAGRRSAGAGIRTAHQAQGRH